MRRIFALTLVISLCACASNARIGRFDEFATLGQRHQAAIAEIVDQAITSNIDANSVELINARDLAVQNRRWPTDADEALDQQNQAVAELTAEYGRLKRHAALLNRYFQALAALARYDGAGIATAASSVATALGDVSEDVAQIRLGGQALPAAVGVIAPIVVSGIKQRRLEQELRRNGDLINRQLELQERALRFVSDRIRADQALIAERRILDQLAVPYADLSRPLPDNWRTARREILLQQALSPEPAAAAAELSAKLRQSFIGLAEGRLSADELADHASNLARILALLEFSRATPAEASR